MQGLSLIELLISLVLSSALILTVSTLYLAVKKHYLLQESVLSTQVNSRLLHSLLLEYVAKAGFRQHFDQERSQVFPTLTTYAECSFKAAQVLVVDTQLNRFCVRYEAATNAQLDCTGQPIEGTAVLLFEFRLNPQQPYLGALYCKNLVAKVPVAVELLSGIADVRLQPLHRHSAQQEQLVGLDVQWLIISEQKFEQVSSKDLDGWRGGLQSRLQQHFAGHLYQEARAHFTTRQQGL